MVVQDRIGRDAAASRLSREDWISAGMSVLAQHGIEGVRVEQIAKALNVTKGSFYWHFKDRDELCTAILEHWRRQNTVDIVDYVGSVEDPTQRLKQLLKLTFDRAIEADPMSLFLALRLWGRQDVRVQAALTEIDQLRVRAIGKLLVATGISEPEARARSVLVYAYARVAATLVEQDDHALQEQCEMILLGGGDGAEGSAGVA